MHDDEAGLLVCLALSINKYINTQSQTYIESAVYKPDFPTLNHIY